MTTRQEESQVNDDTGTRNDPLSDLARCCGRVYEIMVKGQLPGDWSDWLDGLEMSALPCGDTALCGAIVDQAALMGILNKLNRLNVTLLSLCQVDHSRECRSKENKEENCNVGRYRV